MEHGGRGTIVSMTKETRSRKATLPFRVVLTKLMSDRGLTPAQVAALEGVSRSVVGDWLGGAAPRDLVERRRKKTPRRQ